MYKNIVDNILFVNSSIITLSDGIKICFAYDIMTIILLLYGITIMVFRALLFINCRFRRFDSPVAHTCSIRYTIYTRKVTTYNTYE